MAKVRSVGSLGHPVAYPHGADNAEIVEDVVGNHERLVGSGRQRNAAADESFTSLRAAATRLRSSCLSSSCSLLPSTVKVRTFLLRYDQLDRIGAAKPAESASPD